VGFPACISLKEGSTNVNKAQKLKVNLKASIMAS
jgi:hypothetical protein